MNRCVFSLRRKIGRVSAVLTAVGSSFHHRGARTEKSLHLAELPPGARSGVGLSCPEEAERRERVVVWLVIIAWRYEGAVPLAARKARSRALKRIRAAIGSQCNSMSRGVTWADLGRFEIRRAAAFWTSWRGLVAQAGRPARRALQ